MSGKKPKKVLGLESISRLLFRAVSAGCVTGAVAIPGVAFAQTKIEQMVVTAQKRAQDVQAVPASISAFSGDALQERHVSNVEDLQTAAPNLTFSTYAGIITVSIRGVSPDGTSGSIDPSVAMHIDGVYQPRVVGMNIVMNDLEAVEVLRGPQGTLYGRNANAGVINLITKKPTDNFEGAATVFGGSYERFGARGYVSGPISDKISLRLSGLFDRNSGYGKNYLTGQKTEAERSYGARVVARIKPLEDLTIDLAVSRYFSTDTYGTYNVKTKPGVAELTDSSGFGIANYNALVALGGGQWSTEPWRAYFPSNPQNRHIQNDATATVAWNISPEITVKSITGIINNDWRSWTEYDGGLGYPYIPGLGDSQGTTFSQEFNIRAKLWDRLDAVVGLYYLDDHFNGGIDTFFPGGSFSPGPVGVGPTLVLVNKLDQTAKSKAVFFDATLSITDGLRLLGGIRRTVDKKITYQSAYGYGPFAFGLDTCAHHRQGDLKYNSTTGKAGIQYDFMSNIMGYVQWQNGFKTGGYNYATCGNDFAPEKIISWEAGLKSTLFDGTTTLNISLFDYKYKNLQLSRILGIFAFVDNAAKAKIRGGELEFVSNLTDNFRVDLSLGYIDSKYLNYNSAKVAGGLTEDLSGNQLQKAPKFTSTVGLEYNFRLMDVGDLTARGEVYHSSRIYYSAFNDRFTVQDGYTTFNAFLTLTPDDCPYEFRAFGRNLTNKAVMTGAITTAVIGNVLGQWGSARTLGVEATVRF